MNDRALGFGTASRRDFIAGVAAAGAIALAPGFVRPSIT